MSAPTPPPSGAWANWRCNHPDHRIAARLNAEGFATRTGKPWTYARVHSMRKEHGIASACPLHTRGAVERADGMVPAKLAARRLGVSPSLLHVWVRHGVLAHDQRLPASRVWVRLNGDDPARRADAQANVAHADGRVEVVREWRRDGRIVVRYVEVRSEEHTS